MDYYYYIVYLIYISLAFKQLPAHSLKVVETFHFKLLKQANSTETRYVYPLSKRPAVKSSVQCAKFCIDLEQCFRFLFDDEIGCVFGLNSFKNLTLELIDVNINESKIFQMRKCFNFILHKYFVLRNTIPYVMKN